LPGALLVNPTLRFVCRQVDVVVENADTPFTRSCQAGDVLSLPVKHTVGRYFAPHDGLEELGRNGQVLTRYAPGENPNGSLNDVAGVSNSGKNVFGLMPHPEHAVDALTGSTDGAKLFQSLLEHCLEL
jgi:phosphoribosylformylglycinamidine synthase